MLPVELLALGTAFCTALAGVMMGGLSGRVDAVTVTRWSMVFGTLTAAAAALVVGGFATLDARGTVLLAISGFLSIIIAGPCYYASIFSIGPRNAILVFSTNAPMSAILGTALLGDWLRPSEIAGIAIIILGVVLAVVFNGSGRKKRTDAVSLKGVTFGLVSAAGQATGNLAAQPAMAEGADPFAAMAVRAGIAAAAFILFALVLALFRPGHQRPVSGHDIGTIWLSTAIGMGVGMPMLMAALAVGHVGVVSTLASTMPIAVLPLVWIQTGRAPPWPAWVGAVLAVAGTGMLFL